MKKGHILTLIETGYPLAVVSIFFTLHKSLIKIEERSFFNTQNYYIAFVFLFFVFYLIQWFQYKKSEKNDLVEYLIARDSNNKTSNNPAHINKLVLLARISLSAVCLAFTVHIYSSLFSDTPIKSGIFEKEVTMFLSIIYQSHKNK